MEYSDAINEMVRKATQQEQDQLERLCEIMLTTPHSPGISVQRTWDGLACTTVTRLDPEVPFGEIHYHPDAHL